MSHKSKRHSKKKQNEQYLYDMRIIEFLNVQVIGDIIYLISDVLFCRFGILVIESEYNDNINTKEMNTLIVQACYVALIAAIINSKVNFTAYEFLKNETARKKSRRSLQPEWDVSISSLFIIGLYYFSMIGSIEIYELEQVKKYDAGKSTTPLLKLQLIAYQIKTIADYLALSYTLQSISLIKSKYEKNSVNITQDPDVIAVIAARMFVFERIILSYVNYKFYLYTIEPFAGENAEFYIRPNRVRAMANFIGVIGNIIALIGIIELYKRNSILPVFGR